jgi:glucose uptake protein GlcU
VLPPLGFAVGYPVTQGCVVVSGLCGILVYGEIKGGARICAWLLAALLLFAGASALGYFGSQA